MKFIIWHDNDYDLALWVYENSALKNYDVQLRCIPKTNSPGQIREYFKEEITKPVMPFIRFETPDVIIQMIEPENKVIFVTELMTHTPQWQHPAQRFTRLYTSAVLKIPTALILPEYKVKWEKGSKENYKKVSYRCSGSVYNLFYQSTVKNNSPALIFHWPGMGGYLKYDEKHPTSPKNEGDILLWFEFLNTCIKNKGCVSEKRYKERLEFLFEKKTDVKIETFDTIEGIVSSEEFLEKHKIQAGKMTPEFLERKETLIFAPEGLVCNHSDFRTDPYAGMLCAFDVIFCRDGDFKRNVNLVMIAKGVYKNKIDYSVNAHKDADCCFMNPSVPVTETHLSECSYTQPKYRRIYGEIADLVLFEENVVMRKGEAL